MSEGSPGPECGSREVVRLGVGVTWGFHLTSSALPLGKTCQMSIQCQAQPKLQTGGLSEEGLDGVGSDPPIGSSGSRSSQH